MGGYNYDEFSPSDYDLDRLSGPGVGEKAPDAEVRDLAGGRRRLLDFDGQFLVLEFGSVTCPLFQSRRRGMQALAAEHPDVSFAVLYVREAHPGERTPAHRSENEKLERARELRDRDGEDREVLVDDLDGTAHHAYGGLPNSVFVVNQNRCVVYRSAWSNPSATGVALRRMKAGRPARPEGFFAPPRPAVAIRTLRRGGRGAISDFLRGFPVAIWKNLIKRNARQLLGRREPAAPNTTC